MLCSAGLQNVMTHLELVLSVAVLPCHLTPPFWTGNGLNGYLDVFISEIPPILTIEDFTSRPPRVVLTSVAEPSKQPSKVSPLQNNKPSNRKCWNELAKQRFFVTLPRDSKGTNPRRTASAIISVLRISRVLSIAYWQVLRYHIPSEMEMKAESLMHGSLRL